ncbi:MAG: protein TonB [Paracoccaceae bacterium]|jgi:protein TonB
MTVALLTAALYAGALKWGKFTFAISETLPEKIELIDLNLIKFIEAKAEPVAEPTPPEPEPKPPTGEPPVPEPVQPPPPPKVEPPPPPEPKIDPAIVRKKREVDAARTRELQRQREVAKKRVEEKRRRQLAAQKVATAKKKAVAAAKARAAAGQRIVSKPSAVSQPTPKYPSSARRAGHEGTVMLSFTVGTSGKVTSARVSKSSGHSPLDNAAIAAIRRWRFKPARNGLGQAVSYNYSLPIPFRLR